MLICCHDPVSVAEMSSEIVRVVDESESSTDKVKNSSTSNANRCPAFDLFDSRTALNPEVTVDLIGGDYHTRGSESLASEKGLKHVKQLNPTLDSVKPLLEKMKEPSVLLLRGCELLLQSDFPFERFKAVTSLEISGCSHLTTLAEKTISEMTRLQSLHLSCLPISQLPNDLFSNRANLCSLVLRGCSNLHLLPEPPQQSLSQLDCLDLSHLPIETLPAGFISSVGLRSLILRGCSKLRSLPSTSKLFQLHFVDLFRCTSLETVERFNHPLRVLDLSYTALGWAHVPTSSVFLTHLFLRNAKVCNPDKSRYAHLQRLRVCDLSGAQNLEDVNMLWGCDYLEALNLSRTGIEYIGFLSHLVSLRTLVFRECTRLRKLSSIEQLKNLQVLDISGCKILADLPKGLSEQRRLKELNLRGCSGLTDLREGFFDHMSSLEKLDLSKTNFKRLPSFASLLNLRTLNLPADTSMNLSDTPGDLHPGEISNIPSEFHLVSTFISKSGFDRFKYEFTELNKNISHLEKNYQTIAPSTSVVDTPNTLSLNGNFDSLRADLQYILDKIDLLEHSRSCTSSEELLHEIMNYECRYIPRCFISRSTTSVDYSAQLNELLLIVAKLKLLVSPPKQVSTGEDKKKKKKKKLVLTNKEYEPYRYGAMSRHLIIPYESLTNIQRNCLLYFACLPVTIRENKAIKESILIHLWYGEGFFDSLLYANPTPKMVTSTNNGADRNEANQLQVPITEGVENPNTIKEIGRQILQVLQEKGFIEIFEGKWYMEHWVHFLVRTRAMEEHLFDFNKDEKLTPHIAVSGRACLLKSEDNCPSSSQLWLDCTKSSEKLQTFKTVHTLLYIDELVVDIKTEWFSAMQNLSVLHLVNFWSTNEEQIDIVDLKFLEELKNMQQLRLLSLESISAIQKLPDSICKLTNLTILKLRYCTNLEELPAGIGSLLNLIYLDLTQCHLLSELPKGLSSLSKLEVLKGFIITFEVGGQQSRKACTLRQLLKLESLRKLNLVVVNKDSFPRTEDLRVFKQMKNLCSLNITWKENYDEDREPQQKALRHSRWQQLKCWRPQTVLCDETEEEEEEALRSSNCLGNLKKLVLCCFRSETAPSWLRPSELQKLEKLYIMGGNLKTLSEDGTNQTTWKVKTLHLKYVSNLDMDWLILKGIFPDMMFFRKHECPRIRNFTGESDVWTAESEGSQ